MNEFVKSFSNFQSRESGFNRLGIHCVDLKPHSRSSLPHAESLEEEFVFVVKGNPQLWLNGYIHDLKEGHAVGFPAGTGASHSFINNSNENVQLLVAGERTKKDNRCFYPLNPEQKTESPIWWDNPPRHELGPHSGLPGPIKPSERAVQESELIFFCPDGPQAKSFHYPGDSETFGHGFRITDKVGLKALGIWYERMAPGRRSAFPHAHTHEEEFVFVVKGEPTLWIDGFVTKAGPGTCIAFPSNTGHAHTLINETDEEVVYICIGETEEFVGEKISYPLNQLRRMECERKGWYWTDVPSFSQGPHPGFDPRSRKDSIEFIPTQIDGANELLVRMEKSSELLPRDFAMSCSKSFRDVLIVNFEDSPIGVIDIHAHCPEEKKCRIRVIAQSQADRVLLLAEDYARRALDCEAVR